MNDLFVFLTFLFAVLGQFFDAFTTQIGLNNPASGFTEANPIAAGIIKYLGFTGLYALKLAVIPMLVLFIALGPTKSLGAVSYPGAYFGESAWGAIGLVFGTLNYLTLKKAKISVF